MNIIAIIPARYGSTRFPGKPLIKIDNKTMIRMVYEQAEKAFDNVIVATDDNRIADEVNNFGGIAVITSKNHRSGTDRCAEALQLYEKKTGKNFEIIINIQGDEPYIQPEQLKLLANCIQKPNTQIATLIKKISTSVTLFNPNIPKVVINKEFEAIYFSRNPIPYVRNSDKDKWLNNSLFYKHIGLYAYRKNILNTITKLPQSELELSESLEQLRWIENGFKISIKITDIENISIDTPEDLNKLTKKM